MCSFRIIIVITKHLNTFTKHVFLCTLPVNWIFSCSISRTQITELSLYLNSVLSILSKLNSVIYYQNWTQYFLYYHNWTQYCFNTTFEPSTFPYHNHVQHILDTATIGAAFQPVHCVVGLTWIPLSSVLTLLAFSIKGQIQTKQRPKQYNRYHFESNSDGGRRVMEESTVKDILMGRIT